MIATAIAPAAAGTTKQTRHRADLRDMPAVVGADLCVRPSRNARDASQTRITAASGTRFGRMRIAAAAATPAANADAGVRPSAQATEIANAAAAGTSLIGAISM